MDLKPCRNGYSLYYKTPALQPPCLLRPICVFDYYDTALEKWQEKYGSQLNEDDDKDKDKDQSDAQQQNLDEK